MSFDKFDKKIKEAAENHIEIQLNNAFSKYDYEKAKLWYRRKDKRFDLYFYLPPASELMRINSLWLCFEIRNKTNKDNIAKDFLKHFQNEFQSLPNFKQNELASKSQHTHAFIYQQHHFFEKGKPFSAKVEEVLDYLIDSENSPVKKVEAYLEERKCFFTG